MPREFRYPGKGRDEFEDLNQRKLEQYLKNVRRTDAPFLKVTSTTSFSCGDGVNVSTPFSDGSGAFNTAPTYNVGGFVASSTSDKGALCPEPGFYRYRMHVTWSGNVTGVRHSFLTINGSTFAGQTATHQGTSASGNKFEISDIVNMSGSTAATREIGMLVNQNTSPGATLTATCVMTLEWIRPAL